MPTRASVRCSRPASTAVLLDSLPAPRQDLVRSAGDLRDFVWVPAQLTFHDGGGTVALVPARYPGTVASDDPPICWRARPMAGRRRRPLVRPRSARLRDRRRRFSAPRRAQRRVRGAAAPTSSLEHGRLSGRPGLSGTPAAVAARSADGRRADRAARGARRAGSQQAAAARRCSARPHLAVQPTRAEPDPDSDDRERYEMWQRAAAARESVLNFGIPALSGRSPVSHRLRGTRAAHSHRDRRGSSRASIPKTLQVEVDQRAPGIRP